MEKSQDEMTARKIVLALRLVPSLMSSLAVTGLRAKLAWM
jgi:hypothetical protein